MPIRRLHPIDRRELSASIRCRRAKGRCEPCGRPRGRVVLHLGDGLCWDDEAHRWRDGAGRWVRRLRPPHSLVERTRTTRVVLATAHRDHDPATTMRPTPRPSASGAIAANRAARVECGDIAMNRIGLRTLAHHLIAAAPYVAPCCTYERHLHVVHRGIRERDGDLPGGAVSVILDVGEWHVPFLRWEGLRGFPRGPLAS